MAASTLLANELHRRLTFHASAAVGWQRAQLEGGVLAAIGLAATSLALVVLQSVAPDAGWSLQVLLVAAVTGGSACCASPHCEPGSFPSPAAPESR